MQWKLIPFHWIQLKVKQIQKLSGRMCSMSAVWTRKLAGAQMISKHQHYIK